MPALNFKTEFASKILGGQKPFTLRAIRKDGRDPKIGDKLFLFTAMRTKQCRKISEKTCFFAATVMLSWRRINIPSFGVIHEDMYLWRFSRLDGFNNYDEFCRFHEISLGMEPKKMRMISWVTRDEFEELLEIK